MWPHPDHGLLPLFLETAIQHFRQVDRVISGPQLSRDLTYEKSPGFRELRDTVSILDLFMCGKRLWRTATCKGLEKFVVVLAQDVKAEEARPVQRVTDRTSLPDRYGDHRRFKPRLLNEAAQHSQWSAVDVRRGDIEPACDLSKSGADSFADEHSARMFQRKAGHDKHKLTASSRTLNSSWHF